MKARKITALRLGLMAFGGLMALTVFEFWIASMAKGPIPYPVLFAPLAPVTWIAILATANPLPFLGVIAVLKAVLIMQYFMHVSHVWRTEGED